MTEEIKKELNLLEEKYHITILYAVESGSRAWGFASRDSDWDVRFIYVHDYDWYLSVDEKRDNIEIILPSDIDLAGWELKKALLLYKKSNPPLLEWLHSPLVYLERFNFSQLLLNNAEHYFNPKSCLYHYLHMANRNWLTYFKEDVVRVKKYLYVLRPLMACSWIEAGMGMVPMEFDVLLKAETMSDATRAAINELVKRKMAGDELDRELRIPVIDEYITGKIQHLQSFLADFDFKNQPSNEELNNIFRDSMRLSWNKEIVRAGLTTND